MEQGLEQVLSTPLGGPLAGLQLKHLAPECRQHELSFDLPVQGVRTADLVAAFRHDPDARFGADYIEQLRSLDISSRGFLTGSIDLVFSDGCDLQQARWWVADWKSNWIGERVSDAGISLCGPRHYDADAMHAQMLHHHYPLQAHLYLVALHRHLQWRLPGYVPERHLGGYVYVFLRGMPGDSGMSPTGAGPGRDCGAERHWLAFVPLISCLRGRRHDQQLATGVCSSRPRRIATAVAAGSQQCRLGTAQPRPG